MSSSHLPYIINLGNSIIGVAVLAMPFCFKKCGIILGLVLLLFCTWLTLVSCQLLMKAAVVSKKRSYEFLAYYTFGAPGKFVIEVGMIGLQLGTLIAQIVVIGDLGPAIVSKLLGVENTSSLRTYLIVFLCLCVGLPLGMLKDLRSVSRASTFCICFYTVFVFYVFYLAWPNLWTGDWYGHTQFWRPEGLFQTLPIFSFSFGCQTQLFLLYDSLPEPTLKSINGIIHSAVNLCTAAYLLVGFFGYIAFYEKEISGDIITLFPSSFSGDMIKLFFVMSIAVTFPLIIFPCRASLYTLLFPQKPKAYEDLQEENHIPEFHFKFITVCIVIGSMIVGILVPNVEFILGMNGATMGSLICYIFPAVFFVRVMAKKSEGRHIAQLVMILGITILLVSTFATLYTQDKGHTHPVKPDQDVVKNLDNLNKPLDMPVADVDQKNEKRIEPPVPDAPIDSPMKKVDEKKQEELPKKDGIEEAKVPDKSKKKEETVLDRDKKDTENVSEVKNNTAKDKTKVKEEEKKEAAVAAKEENLKEREKKIKESEVKQAEILEKLVEQQEEQKQLIHEQKQLLQELKDHKDEHKNEVVQQDSQEGQPVVAQQQQGGPAVGVQEQQGGPAVVAQQQQGGPAVVVQQQQGGPAVGVQQQPLQGQQPVQGGQPMQGQQLFQGQQPVQGGQPVQGQQQLQGQQPVQGGQLMQGQQPLQGQQPVQGGQLMQGQQPLQGQQPVQGGQPMQGQQPVQGGQPLQAQQPLQGQQPVQGAKLVQGQQPIQGQQSVQGGQLMQGLQQPLQGGQQGQGLQNMGVGNQVGGLGQQGRQMGQQPIKQHTGQGQHLKQEAGGQGHQQQPVKHGKDEDILKRRKRDLISHDLDKVLEEVESHPHKRDILKSADMLLAINKLSRRR